MSEGSREAESNVVASQHTDTSIMKLSDSIDAYKNKGVFNQKYLSENPKTSSV